MHRQNENLVEICRDFRVTPSGECAGSPVLGAKFPSQVKGPGSESLWKTRQDQEIFFLCLQARKLSVEMMNIVFFNKLKDEKKKKHYRQLHALYMKVYTNHLIFVII